MSFNTAAARLARRTVLACGAGAASLLTAGAALAADPTAPTAPMPAPMAVPSMTAPMAANPSPMAFDSGTPLGKIYVTGALTGMAMTQTHTGPGDSDTRADITNAMVIVQSTSGPVQFYVHAGAYSQPFVGFPYMKATDAVPANYGVVPIAYVKIQPTAELSIQAGKLFPLIGDEYTFTFQNLNVFRGLLVAQEPAVSRGVQVNYAKGPIAVSLSLNDGFYSNHYNWLTGSLAYTISPADSVVLSGGGSFRHTAKSTFATPPAQNNAALVDLIWTHTSGKWTISPYLQYSATPALPEFGFYRGAKTYGAAILAKYNLTPEFALAARAEYEKSDSDGCSASAPPACAPTNLLFGPSSHAYSLTFTPTYQKGIFFVRGEMSYVRAGNYTPGFGFGPVGVDKDQFRALAETGVVF